MEPGNSQPIQTGLLQRHSAAEQLCRGFKLEDEVLQSAGVWVEKRGQ